MIKYASVPLKVGDKVAVRYHTDITPGTVIKATATQAVIQLHDFKCINMPGSGHPEEMKFSVGGFSGHMSGRQINEIDGASNRGTVKATFRKKDAIRQDEVVTFGFWRMVGYPGGPGKLGGILYNEWLASYDYNF